MCVEGCFSDCVGSRTRCLRSSTWAIDKMDLIFEWDTEKDQRNIEKHKVSFEEAKTVFGDPFLLTFPDPEHSIDEQRYFGIGASSRGRILVVVHTERDVSIRVISCRKATRKERKVYEETDF